MPRKQITRLRTETLLGCIKYTTWLSWTERGKTVLVWDKSKTHTQTFNANHMLILNRRQILHCYVQSWLKGRKTELSCAEKCPFFSAICITLGSPRFSFLNNLCKGHCFLLFCNTFLWRWNYRFLSLSGKLLGFFSSSPKQKSSLERGVLQLCSDLCK